MTDKTETEKLINKAALDVLTFARSILIVKLRFLDTAMSRLELFPSDDAALATDGMRIIYGPKNVLRRFREDQDKPVHDYLHMVLHCIFSHMFTGTLVDRKLWDLACDIAVENTINDLDLGVTGSSGKAARGFEIERLRAEVKMLTAEKIYRYYMDSGITEPEIERLLRLFGADDHSCWYAPDAASSPDSGDRDDRDDDAASPDDRNDAGDDLNLQDDFTGAYDPVLAQPKYKVESGEPESSLSLCMSPAETAEDWKNIAEKVQEALETFFTEQGDSAGGMMQNLLSVNREKYDYTGFLKKFAVFGENIAVNDEEFDYIYYTYGLRLYKNMPLVEPLEYKEVKRIREFVIAIDTSGSTSGELVRKFLQKTYNILKTTESYFSRINIHIIQCDADIQEHVKIISEEEFDRYISTMTIRGLGGTDFRPVFDLVDRLIEADEFTDLKGLIYFTDGYGTFPARKPGYETAFVFLDNEFNNPVVPPWAIRLVLQNEDI